MEDWWVATEVVPQHGQPLSGAKSYLNSPVGGEVQTHGTNTPLYQGWSANTPAPPLRRPRSSSATRALAIELRTGQPAPDEIRRMRAVQEARFRRLDAERGFSQSASRVDSQRRAFTTSRSSCSSFGGSPNRFTQSARAASPPKDLEPEPPRVQLSEPAPAEAPAAADADDGGWWYFEGEGGGEAAWQEFEEEDFVDSPRQVTATPSAYHGMRPPPPLRPPQTAAEVRRMLREAKVRELRQARGREQRRRAEAAHAALFDRPSFFGEALERPSAWQGLAGGVTFVEA